jgi:PAS domain-containing protein
MGASEGNDPFKKFEVTAGDAQILRELARRAAEIGHDPVNRERARLWNRLNQLQAERPLLYVWQRVANVPWGELDVNGELTLRTETPFARELETELRQRIYRFTHLADDSVFEPKLYCTYEIDVTAYGVEVEIEQSDLSVNDIASQHFIKVIETEDDLDKIQPPVLSYDAERSAAKQAAMREIFDGILDVELRLCRDNDLTFWAPAWDHLVRLMGVEEVLLGFALNPDFMHKAIDRLMTAGLALLDQYEALPLPLTNAGNETTGSGGLAFHDDLQARQAPGNLKNLWGCAASQIFAQGSPEMHNEFAIAYEKRWLERFGLAYYGCCEPLHNRADYLRTIPNLRKVSISPWADLDEAVANLGRDYVLSIKVNPFAFADTAWSLDEQRAILKDIFEKTRGCQVEIIMKDVSTVNHQPERLWQWAEMAKGMVERL